ncbi:MAG TPA: cohesin domain-containing protein [Candidatus Paceibacterota bacterium]|nr:cohesin domain-containing protein [Candidatus Paceibacterota bacterium]
MLGGVRLQIVAVVAGAFLYAPALALTAEAAQYQFSPTPVSTVVGKPFTVTVNISSDKAYNAGGATLKYDPSALSASRVAKDGSAFSIWAVEPAISASAGTVTFEGGHTAPITGDKKVVQVTFTAKKEGATSISVDKGSILAGDGSGADMYVAGAALAVTVGPGGYTEPTPTATPADTGSGSDGGSKTDLPEAPIVTSLTHPKEDVYSGAPTAKFSWELPLDVTVVRAEVDQSTSTVPKQSYDPAIADKEFRDFKEGENYIHIRYKNGSGWGPTTHRKFMVDRAAPLEFTVTATVPEKENNVTLAFSTSDELSGLASYEIVLDGGQPKKISLAEVKDGKYPLLAVPNGSHSAKIVAYDVGGNKREAEAAFMVNAPIKADAPAADAQSNSVWPMVGIAALFACIGGLIGIIWYERNAFRQEKFMTKREADEVRDRIASVFSALREEVDEQLARLYQKPNPSAEDREVTRRIHEATDLSEELLAKEAEDVRKLLAR